MTYMIWVEELQQNVPVYESKEEVPVGYNGYIAIPEANLSQEQIDTGEFAVVYFEGTTGHATFDSNPGYYQIDEKAVGISPLVGLVFVIAMFITIAYIAYSIIQAATTYDIEGIDEDGDGIPDKYYLRSGLTQGIYDPETGSWLPTGGGLLELFDMIIKYAVIGAVTIGGVYIAVKILPGLFAKRGVSMHG